MLIAGQNATVAILSSVAALADSAIGSPALGALTGALVGGFYRFSLIHGTAMQQRPRFGEVINRAC